MDETAIQHSIPEKRTIHKIRLNTIILINY